MARVDKYPVMVPSGVEVAVNGQQVNVSGSKGKLELTVPPTVKMDHKDDQIALSRSDEADNWAMAGTVRALINNMVKGVSEGFEKKLELVGVGYRAQAQGNTLNLVVGFSHPVDFPVPEGITIETPSQTEIVVKGIDKQLVGQVAADIRSFRPPEPYKGKGIKYADEQIVRKEAKKK